MSRFKSKLKTYFSTRPFTNTHDWPAAFASEATALHRYTNLIIIIIICKYSRKNNSKILINWSIKN